MNIEFAINNSFHWILCSSPNEIINKKSGFDPLIRKVEIKLEDVLQRLHATSQKGVDKKQ